MKRIESQKGFVVYEALVVLMALGALALALTNPPEQKGNYVTEVYTIDTKMDDGNGATGTMRTFFKSSEAADFCVDASGNYRVSVSDPLICNFIIKY